MTFRGIVLGTALAVMLPTAAMAASEGFYVGGAAGVNWARDAKFTDKTAQASGVTNPSVKLEYDVGAIGSLSAGYATSFGIRAELEAGYRWGNKVNGDNDATSNWSGRARSLSFMGNVLYDIDTGTPITPYIGVGAGIAQVKATGDDGAGYRFSDTDWVFAYQGIAGVSYSFTNNLAATLDYRYFDTVDPKFKGPLGRVEGEYASHSILLGLRYSFGAPSVTPVATPAPAPAPVQAQPQTEYLVFFDWDKADITPVSDKIIGDAAAAAGKIRAVSIHVIGHTDTSGSPAYNQKLSLRRADAVRKGLTAKGVPAKMITVEGKGETQLLVQTGENVREPSNRRAQILIRVK
ncbi:outer membrane protein OmpA-like peptidoglycan-associated protein [Azospirillum fermentarium]|uniref:OmpA family protein n=1 Tax=Azospirillum fermentarium TaxID=1233114 RepID=UPI0022260428|nr:OmpA family protein [Azospirillum fermentarium]MCW2247521.1 outer membrane protein OmpA-like peptidoglycan-associated protein [Azospirillum fermentarium]